jgi:hypothetical protein
LKHKELSSVALGGDEQEDNFDNYLERGELFVLYDVDLKSVYLMTNEDGILEIQNIVTNERIDGGLCVYWFIILLNNG